MTPIGCFDDRLLADRFRIAVTSKRLFDGCWKTGGLQIKICKAAGHSRDTMMLLDVRASLLSNSWKLRAVRKTPRQNGFERIRRAIQKRTLVNGKHKFRRSDIG